MNIKPSQSYTSLSTYYKNTPPASQIIFSSDHHNWKNNYSFYTDIIIDSYFNSDKKNYAKTPHIQVHNHKKIMLIIFFITFVGDNLFLSPADRHYVLYCDCSFNFWMTRTKIMKNALFLFSLISTYWMLLFCAHVWVSDKSWTWLGRVAKVYAMSNLFCSLLVKVLTKMAAPWSKKVLLLHEHR